MKLIEKRCAKMAQEHYDYRAKLFDMHDFDRETIAVESFKLGAKAAVKELEPVLKELVEALAWYSDRNNWMRSYVFDTESLVPSAWADKLKSQDCAMLNCGGGRARLALQKYKQLTGGK